MGSKYIRDLSPEADKAIKRFVPFAPQCPYCMRAMTVGLMRDKDAGQVMVFICDCVGYAMIEQALEIELLGVGI